MLKIILFAGLLVGSLDIGSAFADYHISTGKDPLLVLPYVASGLFGTDAFDGSAAMMWAGLLLHYCIAFFFTAAFFLLCRRYPLLLRNRFVTGVAYGLLIWAVMNWLVVPLSRVPQRSPKASAPLQVIKAMAILIVMIGLPLSYIARSYLARKARATPPAGRG